MNKPEPPPGDGVGKPIWELVFDDMLARNVFGIEKYGKPLRAHDGRDSLVDLYQELLDAVVYLRKAIHERHNHQGKPMNRCDHCEEVIKGDPCILTLEAEDHHFCGKSCLVLWCMGLDRTRKKPVEVRDEMV